MLKCNKRMCDVCGKTILKEQIYNRSTVPSDKAPLARSLLEGYSFTVNRDGSIIFDTCFDCRLPPGLPCE